jgi:hypothetical protein
MLYSFLMLALVRDGWLTHAPAAFFQGSRPSSYCIRCCVGPKFGLKDMEEKTPISDRSLNSRIFLPLANRYPKTHNLKSYSNVLLSLCNHCRDFQLKFSTGFA